MSTYRPIVFIHGFFGPFDPPATDQARAFAPDLLGYGAHQHVPPESISLREQAEHVHRLIEATFGDEAVDIVGHSIGGAIAMLLVHAHPECVRSVINVEGNFTLDDAFWSASVGRMSEAEANATLDGLRSDPLAWLRGALPNATDDMREIAEHMLTRQPASTLRAMGQSVVATTGGDDYLALVREVFDKQRVHLIAGERSRAGWHAPDWALERCASFQIIEGAGHMMMLEKPEAFASALQHCFDHAGQ